MCTTRATKKCLRDKINDTIYTYIQCCQVAFFDTEESDAPAVRFVSALRGKVTLVHTKRVQLASHEAEKVFPSNQELASRASKGL